MGNLPYVEHWEALVLPSYRSFARAEDELSQILNDGGDFASACYETLRMAMCGSIFLYHFSDIAAVRGLVANIAVGQQPSPKQMLVATRQRIADVLQVTQPHQQNYHLLLGEVANAVKHGVLNGPTMYVDRAGMVLAIMATQVEHGHGKQPNVPQVVVRAEARGNVPERFYSLRGIMDAVLSAWNGLQLGLSLP